MRHNELWRYERQAQEMGYEVVAGVDEVGMGSLAGPVVAGAVVLAVGVRLRGLDDSKRLSAREREKLDRQIRRMAKAVAICAVDNNQVDALGLRRARNLACAGAVSGLALAAEYLLVDAWDVPDIALAQMAVIRGDSISASIMAASIVAKVARDRLMLEYDAIYPHWGFAKHKGYASREHRAAIASAGASPIHRITWSPWQERVEVGARAERIGLVSKRMSSLVNPFLGELNSKP